MNKERFGCFAAEIISFLTDLDLKAFIILDNLFIFFIYI